MIKPDAIDNAAVWKENRDEIFLARFSADIAKLIDAGVPVDIARKVVCQYEYVRLWTACPRWLWPVKKLPEGRKWSDGEKTHFKKRGRKGSARTIILLPIGDDLYIRDTEHMEPPGAKSGESKGICIRNFRQYPGKDVASEFDRVLEGLILAFYKKHGLPFGYAPPIVQSVFGNAHPEHKRDPEDKRLDIGFRVLKVVDADEKGLVSAAENP